MDVESAVCAECGFELDEPVDVPVEERTPCPSCGSTRRVVTASATLHARGSMRARGTLIRAWDGVSVTLFGVLYGIAVTVAGVIVAMIGSGGSWLWWAIYAGVSVGVLLLALLVFPQAVIASMRWLVERAKKAPPWPR
jgi:DNA-directed RNA polymerase subunit RPC12/RpoP